MSKTIHLPISSHSKILVSLGEHITAKTLLVKSTEEKETETIHLAKLLGVPASKIPQFLKKKIGEPISAGDVIAEKKGLFSSSAVRSPVSGKLGQLDLVKGILHLVKYSQEAKSDLFSPVKGKIVGVSKSYLEVEAENPIFKAVSGGGFDVTGKLKYIPGTDLGTLAIDGDIQDTIVLVKSVKEETLPKFSVLGVLGAIFLQMREECVLPWVVTDDNIFEKLTEFSGKNVWLRPKEKEVIILE